MARRRPAPPALASEPVEVELVDAAFGGEAIGRLPDGRVVFVPRALPGERALVQPVEERRDFARGELVRLGRAVPGRVEPPCQHYRQGCGGCSWQHADYALQLRIKEEVVVDQLRRIGRFQQPEALVKATIGMLEPWHYRNQARFTVGRKFGELCFTYRSSHRLLRVEHCWIVHPRINALLEHIQGRLPIDRRIHQLSIRVGANTGALLIAPALPELGDVESGQPFLEEELLGRRFRLSPPSFFQVNTRREQRPLPAAVSRAWLELPEDGLSMAEILALLVLDRLEPRQSDLVVDAYSGVGTFALLLAGCVGEVIGIEEARSAISDAVENGRDAGNVSFVQARTEDALPELRRRPDAVILDPARVGAHPAVLAALLSLRPRRIVYVSCDPSTLARDLRVLVDGGYTLGEVQPLDMFPQTYHVECVATLTL
ncbi:MAG: class I SAM-dependent RNA methyltransferase [Chloroflexota bacterium]|nr:class I SAM-dependent RNA methyltransferase [Chloroflexota bacterium]